VAADCEVSLRILTNILANGFTRLWSAGLQFLLTPVFVRLLGTESFGLVAFFNTVLFTFVFLDWAISPALTREVARMMGSDGAEQGMANLLRTFELVTWLVAVFLAISLFCAAEWITHSWLNIGKIDPATATMAVRMMAVILIAQWPISLYGAGFVALFRQSTLGVIRVCGTTIQMGGALILLYFYHGTITTYFAWQALVSGLTTFALAFTLWRAMPIAPRPARFSLQVLKSTWRFSIGNLLIGFASCVLAQADKLIVAKFTNLLSLAAYSLCFTLALLITNLIVAPVQSILLPRFSLFVARGEDAILAQEYQLWTQLLAVLSFPIAAVLIGLPSEVVSLWLGRHIDLLPQMRFLLPPVALGAALSAITFPVYCLQLATGWTRLSVVKNAIALAVVLPTLWLLVPLYGPIVGAWCWLGVNLGYYFIEVPVMHRRVLKGSMREWYLRSTLPAFAVTLIPSMLANLFVPTGLTLTVQFLLVFGMIITVFWGLVLLLPYPRDLLFWLIRNCAVIMTNRSLSGLMRAWEGQAVGGTKDI